MQNRLKDRDRGGYTSDRYRPHDNYTNAFNMLAQIGLAEKEVTNSMRNAVTQAANVKALQDRLKFDVSSQSAKLKQSALDYNTGLQMKYKDFIQTYMDSNEDKRKKEIEEWIETNWGEYDDNDDDGFEKALNDHIKEVYDMDMAAAKKRYKAISDIIESHSDDTQKYIEEFDNANGVFSFYPNNPDGLDNKIKKWAENSQDNYYNDSAFIKAVKKHKKEVYGMDIDTAKEKDKAILDNIESHSDNTQEYIGEFDNASVGKIIGSSIMKTNAIIERFFKKLLSKEINNEY